MSHLLEQPIWRVIDQSALGKAFEAKQSFAIDDTLCYSVGHGESGCTARSWVHHQTVILGIQDTRLPFLQEGLDVLKQAGYHYVVRNSGGLAVVLDEGVLNLSLIFPEQNNTISIDDGYEAMVFLIKKLLEPYGLSFEDKEIEGSYCPGRYDLSINGRKFAGISQRRLRHGVAVQIYLCADGSGSDRASLIKNFYDAGVRGEETRFVYPTIRPETMASLSELSGQPITVPQLMNQVIQSLQQFGAVYTSTELTAEERLRYDVNYQRMVDRNVKAFQ